ncbi:amidase family protein, partial [Arenibaculum sp.]|uniref:amidase family protein n=1 Tax=Arenibaculum sp. TaxID=2865862 RepID=UPI002E0D1C58|nr:amidase family protein [Arenibaculum sp.]
SDGAGGARRAVLLEAQAELCRRWEAVFLDWDVVVAPAFGTAAPRHDDAPPDARRLAVDGRDTAFADQMAWSSMASLANLPATAVPVDRTAAGLPVGVQVVGPPLGDRTTIGFAALLEREFGGFRAPPAG